MSPILFGSGLQRPRSRRISSSARRWMLRWTLCCWGPSILASTCSQDTMIHDPSLPTKAYPTDRGSFIWGPWREQPRQMHRAVLGGQSPSLNQPRILRRDRPRRRNHQKVTPRWFCSYMESGVAYYLMECVNLTHPWFNCRERFAGHTLFWKYLLYSWYHCTQLLCEIEDHPITIPYIFWFYIDHVDRGCALQGSEHERTSCGTKDITWYAHGCTCAWLMHYSAYLSCKLTWPLGQPVHCQVLVKMLGTDAAWHNYHDCDTFPTHPNKTQYIGNHSNYETVSNELKVNACICTHMIWACMSPASLCRAQVPTAALTMR